MPEVQFPVPSVPIVEPKTGRFTRQGRWFLHEILVRIGGLGDVTGLFVSDIDDTVQAWDAELDAIAALTPTDSNFIVGDGSTWVTETGATVRTSLGLAIGADVQAWDADLDTLAALSNTGLLARTGAATYAERTLTGPVAGITVSDGDGVSGNPTLALANDLSALEGLGSTGIAARTGSDAWAQRTITAADGAFWVDGDGVSGNPTIDVAMQVFEVTVGQGDLATGGEVILLDAETGETWKVMDIWYDGSGTDFAGGGGDRLLDVTDGTSIWSAIPAATLAGINGNPARWGNADLPNPATDSHMFAASQASTDIVVKYSGGATDYTAGSIVFRLTAYRIA